MYCHCSCKQRFVHQPLRQGFKIWLLVQLISKKTVTHWSVRHVDSHVSCECAEQIEAFPERRQKKPGLMTCFDIFLLAFVRFCLCQHETFRILKKCSTITFFIFKWLEAEFGTSAPSLKTNSKKCYNIAVFDTLKNIFIWNSAESLSNYSGSCSHTPYQHHGYTDTSCTLVVINRVSRTTAVNHFRHRWICL